MTNKKTRRPVSQDPLTQLQVAMVMPDTDEQQSKLEVMFYSMPESCGRTNWTVSLRHKKPFRDYTLYRSEYPDRARYNADYVRWVIGEITEAPFILDYDADKLTPCHLCGGSGELEGKPCPGLKFDGPGHFTSTGAVRTNEQ